MPSILLFNRNYYILSYLNLADLSPFNLGPIVGLQVRRTDKVGTEANYHSVDEYMQWTEIWFKVRDSTKVSSIQNKIPFKNLI